MQRSTFGKTKPGMKFYSRYVEALVLENGEGKALDAIAALSLEKRYVWRVTRGLDQVFSDIETINVEVDANTLSPGDWLKVTESLRDRPTQFCRFMQGLVGSELMEKIMFDSIAAAKEGE